MKSISTLVPAANDPILFGLTTSVPGSGVAVIRGRYVPVAVGIWVGVLVSGVRVGVAVDALVAVGVRVGVLVGVRVGVPAGVPVGVGDAAALASTKRRSSKA